MPIRLKLLAGLLLVSFLPISTLGLVGYIKARDVLRTHIVTEINNVAEFKEGTLLLILQRLKDKTKDLATDALIQRTVAQFHGGELSEVERQAAIDTLEGHLIRNKMPRDAQLRRIDIVALDRSIIGSTSTQSKLSSFGASLFFESAKTRSIVDRVDALDPDGSGIDRLPALRVGVPILAQSSGAPEPIGILVSYFSTDPLSGAIRDDLITGLGAKTQNYGGTERPYSIYLVNARGKVLAATTRHIDLDAGDTINTEPVDACARHGEELSGFWSSHNDISVVGAAMCIEKEALRWTLIVEQPENEAFGTINTLGMVFMVLSGILLAVSLVWFVLLSRSIVNPLRKLRLFALKIGKGSTNLEVDIHTNDEIGVLADSFREMGKQIDERTERLKEEASKLELLNHKLQYAMQAKADFLASMTHEIRTPLNSIIGTHELLRGTVTEDDRGKYLDIQGRASEHLLTLVNDILDFSKIESGQMALETLDFYLRDMVLSTSQIVAQKAKKKGIELVLDIAEDLPDQWTGDPSRLTQVILNLLSNALKFTESGFVKLSVKPHENPGIPDQTSSELLFTVADSGIGIPPDKCESVFEPFTQGDTSITRKYGGTGLGLTISKKLVNLMKGQIWVESELGKGSTFYFTVRLKKAITVRQKTDTMENLILQMPLQILHVDDDADAQLLVQAFLKNTPYHVEFAQNGKEGTEKFKAGKFDLIVMDTQMPIMSGYEATNEIRAWEAERQLPQTPIISLSANSFTSDIQKALDSGCTCYLRKPLRKNTLLRKIYEIFNACAEKKAA